MLDFGSPDGLDFLSLMLDSGGPDGLDCLMSPCLIQLALMV